MIKRYKKESLVLQYLEYLCKSKKPIFIGNYKIINDPVLFCKIYSIRINNPVTQAIYNNAIQEVGVLKTELKQ
jgi:hypothetical protein